MGVLRQGKQVQLMGFLAVAFLVSLLASDCDGHSSRRLPLAGIFGIGGNKDTSQQHLQLQQNASPNFRQQQQRPPPPAGTIQGSGGGRTPWRPLPPKAQAGPGDIPGPPRLARQTAGSIVPPQSREQNFLPRRPPPPPPSRQQVAIGQNLTNAAQAEQIDSTEGVKETEKEADSSPQLQLESDPYQMQRPPPQGWMAPPPMEEGAWGPPYYDPYQSGDPMYIHGELDRSLARENELLVQLDNLTEAVVLMEQREELHVRQLDVLTERIMDIEAQSAEDRNLVAGYEANCTALGLTIASLQNESEDWQKRCSELSKSHEKDEETILQLKTLIKEKEGEAEDIAIAIENIRLAEKRREAIQSRRGSKKKSLLARFFGLFIPEKDEFEEMTREDVYDLAKSTLLRALQSERGNVHELEGVVASLQQNNSAISEMVESRDTIIDELNNRISVFEEDKVVLKAALRQLQKEIKEEAPKAQKLMDDLEKAEEKIVRMKEEMNGLIRTHQDELIMLQQTISSKQRTLTESESNLTAIGTYVDKLEDRLTSFAVTRRDMEQRERKCKEIEEAAAVIEAEKKDLEAKVETYSKEEAEVKQLLEELVTERSKLQKDNRKLATDSEFRVAEQEQLQAKCTSLEREVTELSDALEDLRANSNTFTLALEAAEQTNLELLDRTERAIDQESQLGKVQSENLDLQEEVQKLKAENTNLEGGLANATRVIRSLEIADDKENEDRETPTPFAVPVKPRTVPFRAVRKQLSKATGIHGAITPSSAMLKGKSSHLGRQQMPDRRRPPLIQKASTAERQPPSPPPLPP